MFYKQLEKIILINKKTTCVNVFSFLKCSDK